MGILLSVIIHSPWSTPNLYSDIGSFYNSGGGRFWIVNGNFPNLGPCAPDFQKNCFEYPPIAGFIIYFARVVGGSSVGYYLVVSLLSILAALGIAWSSWRTSKALGKRLHPLYFMLPSVIVYGLYNFDLFNAFFIVLSLQLFLEDRKTLSAVSLGVSVATKLVGAVLLPVFLLEFRGARQRGRYLGIAAATAAVFFVPVALANFGYVTGFIDFFRAWGLEDAWFIWIFQDPFSSAAKAFSLLLTVSLLVAVYALRTGVAEKAFLSLCAYLLGAYIYAPQYNLMLIPLVAVLAVESSPLFVMETFNALIILTWFGVSDPTHAWTMPQLMALIRTAALAWLAYSVARSARAQWRESPGSVAGDKVVYGTNWPIWYRHLRFILTLRRQEARELASTPTRLKTGFVNFTIVLRMCFRYEV